MYWCDIGFPDLSVTIFKYKNLLVASFVLYVLFNIVLSSSISLIFWVKRVQSAWIRLCQHPILAKTSVHVVNSYRWFTTTQDLLLHENFLTLTLETLSFVFSGLTRSCPDKKGISTIRKSASETSSPFTCRCIPIQAPLTKKNSYESRKHSIFTIFFKLISS